MKKITILGPTGQLGSALTTSATRLAGLGATTSEAPVDLREPDIFPSMLRALDFDVLVNCAAYTAVDAAEHDAEEAFAVNGFAVEALARLCADSGRRFVHVSTDYVFDGEARRPYPPSAAPGPLSVYGESKLLGEALAMRAHPRGTVIVRTSSLFGHAGRRAGRGNFVETMLRLAEAGERIRVVDDIRMAPTSAADLADGILRLIDAEPEPGLYHLTNAGDATWLEFARAVFDVAGKSPSLEGVQATKSPMAARRPQYSVLDSSKTIDLIGPMPHWRDALARYIAERNG